jgi:hypothetical protein
MVMPQLQLMYLLVMIFGNVLLYNLGKMTHPFINDLSDKTFEQLQETITSLNNKLTFAYRTGNSPLISQLQMALASYREESNKKMDDLLKKQNIKSTVNIQPNPNSSSEEHKLWRQK